MEDEYYELKRTGYAGEGFYSPGFRVGTGVSHNLPPHLARLKAAEAAERRIQVSGVLNGGGRKLGGVLTAPGGGLSLRELTAQVMNLLSHLSVLTSLLPRLQNVEYETRHLVVLCMVKMSRLGMLVLREGPRTYHGLVRDAR